MILRFSSGSVTPTVWQNMIGSIHCDEPLTQGWAENPFDLLGFTLAHQTGIDENRCNAIANGFLDQGGCDGRINAAAQR